MHEIVTLQLGHSANYIGTHFWNAQESYFTYGDAEPSPIDHNVHFRPGVGPSGVDTFTPRVLLYDLKGGFGTMKKINALYDLENEPNQETVPYQKDLEAGLPPAPLTPDTVRYWSDFNRVYYHPRSSIQLNEYELDSKIAPFEGFDIGAELFHQLNREHDLIDRDFRFFAEECDQMQGLQFITSVDDAWGGFASEYIAELRDEYGKLPIQVWALERGERVTRDKQLNRTVAMANTLTRVGPLASLYVPLRSPPSQLPGYITLDRTVQWQTSGLLSAAIETHTLPTRYRGTTLTGDVPRNMWDLTIQMNVSGRQNIAVLDMSVATTRHDEPRPSVYSPRSAGSARIVLSWEQDVNKERTFAEAQVVRGFHEISPESEEPAEQPENDKHRSIFRSQLAYPVLDSFPAIMPTYSVKSADESSEDKYTTLDARLYTSSRVINHIRRLRAIISRVSGIDDREALLSDLGDTADAYEEGWNSDFSDDDDDV